MIRRSASAISSTRGTNESQTPLQTQQQGNDIEKLAEEEAFQRTQRRRRRRQRIKKQRNHHVRGGLLLAIPLLLIVVTTVTVSLKALIRYSKQHSNKHQQHLLFQSSFPPPFPKITRTTDRITPSPEALDMCTRALWHTLETTTIVLPDGESFVHTGDIDDLWLRDSAAQVHPYLIPILGNNSDDNNKNGAALIAQDGKLDRIVSGLIARTARYIRHDPYANAFRIDDSYHFSQAQKKMGRHDLISTWNYELDSGCYYMRMLYFYWKTSPTTTNNSKDAAAAAATASTKSDDSVLMLPRVREAVDILIDVWTAEQRHQDDVYPKGQLFDCVNCDKPYRYPGLANDGKGTPTNSSAGLTWTGFRPSDDECKYGYLVPANMFAIVVLEYMVEMATILWRDTKLANKAQRLAQDIERGIQEHAIVTGPDGVTKMYAYEVDGLGNYVLMDDANVPSLMSIPYLGYRYDADIYTQTRNFILSSDNPTYRRGSNAFTGEIEGYGSPHMENRIKDNIWPMALAIQGLTSDDVQEKVRIVETLVKASAGTGWMHESFSVSNPKRYTRSWFCWADALFAELVLSLTDACPDPEHKYDVLEWRDPNVIPGGRFALD